MMTSLPNDCREWSANGIPTALRFHRTAYPNSFIVRMQALSEALIVQSQNAQDFRQWPESGCGRIELQPKPISIRSRFQAVVEMLAAGAVILAIMFGCASCEEAKAVEPQEVMLAAMVVPMIAAVEWSHAVNGNPHFPFGNDERGRPIFPISHTRDGKLIVGTASAYGDK